MCFIIDFQVKEEAEKYIANSLIAKSNMDVWKVMLNKIQSPIGRFIYIFNRVYKTSIRINKEYFLFNPDFRIIGTKGFHSYISYKSCEDYMINSFDLPSYSIVRFVLPK